MGLRHPAGCDILRLLYVHLLKYHSDISKRRADIAGVSYAGQVVYFAWANQILAGDDARRGIVLFSMNMFSSVLFAFWGVSLPPQATSDFNSCHQTTGYRSSFTLQQILPGFATARSR